MNGTTASTSDIKDVISNLNIFETMNGVLLYLDEIQYFNKKHISKFCWSLLKTGRLR